MIYAVLLAVMAPAVFFDVRQHRIPNLISLLGLVAGLVLHTITDGAGGLWSAMLGFLLFFAIAFPIHVVGWLGAGDVKLIAATGAIVTTKLALPVLGSIAIAGLVMSLCALLWRGALGNTLRRYLTMAGSTLLLRRLSYIRPSNREQVVLPYGVAIGAGSFLGVSAQHWLAAIGV